MTLPSVEAVSGYTSAALARELLGESLTHSVRVEILDRDMAPIGDVPVISSADETNVDQGIVRSCQLRMLPVESLRDVPYQRNVRIWLRLRMPDGGDAEWLAGTFVWSDPTRVSAGDGAEEWEIRCGGQLHWLEMWAPDRAGFTVRASDRVTDRLRALLERAGFSDTSGVVASDERLEAGKTWDVETKRTQAHARIDYYESLLRDEERDLESLRRARSRSRDSHANRLYAIAISQTLGRVRAAGRELERWRRRFNEPVVGHATGLSIATELCLAIGYAPPWEDATGRIVMGPAVALEHETPVGASMRMVGDQQVTHRHEWCNVLSGRRETDTGFGGAVTVTADDLWGAGRHPLSESVIGRRVVGEMLVDDVATSPVALRRRVSDALRQRLVIAQEATVETLLWPDHGPWDVVAMDVEGDTTGVTRWVQRAQVRHHGTWTMTRRLGRVWDPVSREVGSGDS